MAAAGSGAMAAALAVAAALGLAAGDAVILQESNRLTVRLRPGDVVARVARGGQEAARLEVELARRLAAAGSPVAAPDPRVAPRVYEHDGWTVTLWAYYEPASPREVPPASYARALRRLHAGLRLLDVPAPHFTERVGRAQRLVARRDLTPALGAADRELLGRALRDLRRAASGRGAAEQLLHGEPHPGNVLATSGGPLFTDFETCCRGPVEFDLAHAPEPAGQHYPGIDHGLLRECRLLVLAMITAWRWDSGDQLPGGRELAAQWLGQLRAGLGEPGTDEAGSG